VGASQQRPNWREPITKVVSHEKFVLGRQTASGKVCRMILDLVETKVRYIRMLAPIAVQAMSEELNTLVETDPILVFF